MEIQKKSKISLVRRDLTSILKVPLQANGHSDDRNGCATFCWFGRSRHIYSRLVPSPPSPHMKGSGNKKYTPLLAHLQGDNYYRIATTTLASMLMTFAVCVAFQATIFTFFLCGLPILCTGLLFTQVNPVTRDLMKVTDALFGQLSERQVTSLTMVRLISASPPQPF